MPKSKHIEAITVTDQQKILYLLIIVTSVESLKPWEQLTYLGVIM